MPVRSREIHSLSSRIQLPILRKLLSIMDGQHSALRQGRGWEFLDLAPYQAGDDVRFVDTGREMGALAPSGETKEEVALAACEAIAWLSVARGDQIGLVAGDSERVRFLPARSGNAHAETVLRRIEEDITLSSPHSDVPKLLARARTVIQRRSLIVIVTDATQPEPTRVADDLIKSLSVRHRVIQVSVADMNPADIDQDKTVIDVNEGPLPDFLRRDEQLAHDASMVVEQRRAAVAKMLDTRGVIQVSVSSSEGVPRALLRALQRSGSRR